MKRKTNTYYSNIILKQTPQQQKLRKIKNFERLSDEKTYMKARYDSMYNRHNSKKKAKGLKYGTTPIAYRCYISWPELWKAWQLHKKKHGGMYCALTGEEMTHIGSNHPDHQKYSRNWNNISIDRLDSLKPYTLQNIIFTTWKVNRQKNDFPLQYMKKLLKLYNSRFVKLESIN